MSEWSGGTGWWQASDGRWYPPPAPQQSPPLTYAPRPAPATPTNGKAIAALVLGILSPVLCYVLTGIPAIVLGVKARREIRSSNGTQAGDGLALAGLVLGIVGTALTALFVGFVLLIALLGEPAGMNSDPSDGYCNDARYWQDPDC